MVSLVVHNFLGFFFDWGVFEILTNVAAAVVWIGWRIIRIGDGGPALEQKTTTSSDLKHR